MPSTSASGYEHEAMSGAAQDDTRRSARYAAVFLDGWSLAETHVLVESSATHLHILDSAGAPLRNWDGSGLRSDAMQEGGVLHVSHASAEHETLVVRDPELRAHLLGLRGRVHALPGGANRPRFVLACLAGLITLGALLYVWTPAIARFIAHRVPLEQERALGAQVETLLDLAVCKDGAATTVLQRLERRLSGRDHAPIDVRIMQADHPNAFALPGGIVLLSEPLIEQASSADEIAGVLAHEIEHVVQRHVLSGFVRDTLLTGLWAITIGDYAGLLVVDPGTAYRIANLEFSREDEAAADRGAIERLHRAGLAHAGLAAFLERAAANGDGAGESLRWLSTHPSTAQRIAEMRALPDLPERQPALSDDELAVLRAACARAGR
jgi:beta-barrel assembly-enhancing protease